MDVIVKNTIVIIIIAITINDTVSSSLSAVTALSIKNFWYQDCHIAIIMSKPLPSSVPLLLPLAFNIYTDMIFANQAIFHLLALRIMQSKNRFIR